MSGPYKIFAVDQDGVPIGKEIEVEDSLIAKHLADGGKLDEQVKGIVVERRLNENQEGEIIYVRGCPIALASWY